MDQLLQLAQAEESALLAELRKHPAFAKLEAVRALLAAYDAANKPTPNVFAARPPGPSARPTERPGTLGARVVQQAEAYLDRMGRRAPASEILEAIMAAGITIGGEKPINGLSSTLSHHSAFDNVRGRGYGLSAWNGEEPALRRLLQSDAAPPEKVASVGDGSPVQQHQTGLSAIPAEQPTIEELT